MRSRSRTHTPLTLTALEAREVPAAFSFSNGVLTVNMAEVAGRSFTIGGVNSNGIVVINSRSTGPSHPVQGTANGALRADQVTAVNVIGSSGKDGINLTAVTPAGFRNLRNIDISGGGARDTIYGSAFDDRIRGGGGNDRIFGGLGADRIWGEGDDDEIYGDGNSGGSNRDGGADRIDGGSGNDTLNGGGGGDVLIGNAGADMFTDQGLAGWDVFWVDSADRAPSRGWRSAGAEDAPTGPPPAI